MKNPKQILKTRTIMTRFKKNSNLTLAKMGEEYGMDERVFLDTLYKVVGKENFAELQRINARRLKSGKGKPVILKLEEEDDQMKARVREDLENQKANIQAQTAKKAEATSEETSKEEKNTMEKENNIVELQEKLKKMEGYIEATSGQIMALEAMQQVTRAKLQELEQSINSLRLEEAERDIEIQEKQAQLENTKAEQFKLQEELDSLTKVILIAPRYKGGKISKTIKMISSKGRDGVEEERVPKDKWFSKPTWESFENSGHKDKELFEEDFEFVQLVLKYQCEGKRFELRANETIKNMIRFEGGEV